MPFVITFDKKWVDRTDENKIYIVRFLSDVWLNETIRDVREDDEISVCNVYKRDKGYIDFGI